MTSLSFKPSISVNLAALPYSSDRSRPCPASVHYNPLHVSHCTCTGMRPTGRRSPLNVTYVAFSLYHLPLQDSSGLHSAIVNVLQPNPFFSTGRPTPMFPPPTSASLPAFAITAIPLLSGSYHPYTLHPQIPISLTISVSTALRSAIVQLNHSQSPDQYPRLLPSYTATSQAFWTSLLCRWLFQHPLRTNSTPTTQSTLYSFPSPLTTNRYPEGRHTR